MLRWWTAIMIALTALLAAQALLSRHTAPMRVTAAVADSLTMVATPPDMDNVHVAYTGFHVDFNPTLHMANCTAYTLTEDKLDGPVERHDKFAADSSVKGCLAPDAYRGSGMDRGHLVPAGDMRWDARAMSESFLMTNICPQHKSLNSGGWSKLEEKVREWVRRDSVLVVLAGPLHGANPETRATGRMTVPQRFFKVVLAPAAQPMPRAIAFVYPNGPCNRRLADYAMSVDDVERLSGIDFFPALPDEVENDIESRCNLNAWTE